MGQHGGGANGKDAMTPDRSGHVVFFDAANTLLRPHPGVGAVYAAVAAEFGVTAKPDALNEAFPLAWKEARRKAGASPYGTGEDDALRFWRCVVEDTFVRAGLVLPGDPFFETLYRRFASNRCWRLYDDALPALAEVRRRGARIGLISNFDNRLRSILTAKGLDRILDIIVISCEVGAEKPAPAIFAAARAAAGNPPFCNLAFVGDQRSDDYAGATNAGWRACLIDRVTAQPDNSGVPAFRSLVAAVEYLLA
ncbi:MAG: hypothetical protein PWP23_659 [Candidatus Sumerlaeota bacterium]|nr:hypothetical protein [Candidatus Sumerlaeota bacterium]